MGTDVLGVVEAYDACSNESEDLETGRNVVIPLDLAHGVASCEVGFDTVDEILHSLDHFITEHISGTLMINEVVNGHQEVAVIHSVLDTQLNGILAVIKIHNPFIRHIPLIELSNNIAGRLPRSPISTWYELLIEWFIHYVSCRLVLGPINHANITILKNLRVANGASTSHIVVAFLEEQSLHIREHPSDGLVEGWWNVSD